MEYLPLTRKKNLVTKRSGEEILLYDLKSNRTYCLNKTSAEVWNLCDGKLKVHEIGDELSKKAGVPIAEELVWLALEQLNDDGLLEEGYEINQKFTGLTRREVIRKVGFASAVTLPFVSSLVAPKALLAQSLTPLGQPCAPSSTCASSGFCASTVNEMIGVTDVPTGLRCCLGAFAPTLRITGSTFCAPSCAGDGRCCNGDGGTPNGTNPACAGMETCIC